MQDRAPISIEQWYALPVDQKVGNFWVIDRRTSWAYWASALQSGEATSYLLDAAEMTSAANNIAGRYYYGIHVESQLITPDRTVEFMDNDPEIPHHPRLPEFLQAVAYNANSDGNPGPYEDSQPNEFNFSMMRPGRIFTMAGERYRYLENMGSGNHMIIRSDAFGQVAQPGVIPEINNWYANLNPAVQAMVQPVTDNFTTGTVAQNDILFENGWWQPTNLASFPVVAADVTTVLPGGTPRAFPLSMADVVRLSGPNRAFATLVDRGAGNGLWWRLRTPGQTAGGVNSTWSVGGFVASVGALTAVITDGFTDIGVRPAIIIHQ